MMITKMNRDIPNFTIRKASGMTLLDVLLAIVIFVVGMLALAALQGNLTRSSTDASVRTMATNLAEELIEGMRTIADLVGVSNQVITNELEVVRDAFDRNGIDLICLSIHRQSSTASQDY